jgi:hypothetical protein
VEAGAGERPGHGGLRCVLRPVEPALLFAGLWQRGACRGR